MRILFLTRYNWQAASSRYRFLQYMPLLERAGHSTQVQPLVDDAYLKDLYQKGRRRFSHLMHAYARRLVAIPSVSNFDAVVCEQEVLPFLSAVVEEFVRWLNPRFIVDYDDAAYVKYGRWPILRHKIPRVMAAAEAVVVGNGYLAEYARRFNPHVFVIPTVVDLSRYPNRQSALPSATVRVAWIGTPVTASLLRSLLPVFGELQRGHPNMVLRFIGAGNRVSLDGLRFESLAWSERTETQLLAESDIGIMPLLDSEFARAKCALKLVQYMACGLPVVASPVGVNREVVQENQNGFLAATEKEWLEKLEALIANPELRKRMGEAGRAKVASQYTLERGFAKWKQILERSYDPSTARESGLEAL